MTSPEPTTAAATRADVDRAVLRLAPYARRTPTLTTVIDGHVVSLKLEHLQLTGAFKLRGALNALVAGQERGTVTDRVVTASGGNHGLAVATAARLLGLNAAVYVPETTPEAKARRLANSGAELVRIGEHYAVAAAAARERAERDNCPYLHAYDDPDVVAGQGTIGVEVLGDVPECDAIVAAVGGGGLIAGISAAASPKRRAIGVEPQGCQSLHAALAAGEPVDTPVDSVASSALGAARIGAVPLATLGAHPAATALVSDAEIVSARDRLWEEFRLAVEPAAAAPLAAWLAGRVSAEHPCLVLCGANADWIPA
ncbi:serine/threonine dehydratase [Lipingzhangella sp. LS1_29]|uniref:Serine/threonine dehydratase n=1 Tax=Lipingzhangella rawalii TaxID=2055835 RepID=A0ABU2H1S8_9ACTN|nr:serine/threonine dehydratase [Lipingzhangella rawalii]MDS1269248.1 serine/threonine dehydratase [Lipingzhangella rawalii]